MFPQLDALPSDTEFLMLNALWFRPDGGEQLYRRYLREARPFSDKYGAKAETITMPQAALIGEFDADLVFFVRWPSVRAFRQFLSDEGYRKVMRLREEAIVRSLLVPCLPL